MTPADVVVKCDKFQGPDELGFKDIVSDFLSLPGVVAWDLARDMKVAPSTVRRWASGSTAPGGKVQDLVVLKISERLAPKS